MDAASNASKTGAAGPGHKYVDQEVPLRRTDQMVHYPSADDLPPEICADNWDKLRSLCLKYMDGEDYAKVERAYCFAAEKHSDQKRRSGEMYINHPVEVAIILAELKMDCDVVCAALLHDTVEDRRPRFPTWRGSLATPWPSSWTV